MDKLLAKILIILFATCFIPSGVFAFFSQPDPYMHSEPFGVQKIYPGDETISPPENFIYNNKINSPTSQDIIKKGQEPAPSAQTNLSEPQNKSQKSLLQQSKKLLLPAVLVAIFLAILIFLIAKIIKSE